MPDNYDVVPFDELSPEAMDIPQMVMTGLALDYLLYRYALRKEKIVVKKNDAHVWIHVRFKIANKKDHVEIDIWIEPCVMVVKRHPSKEHPQGYKLEGVRMRTSQEHSSDMDVERILKDIAYPLRFEIAHLPSVLSQDAFDQYAMGSDS